MSVRYVINKKLIIEQMKLLETLALMGIEFEVKGKSEVRKEGKLIIVKPYLDIWLV